MLPFGVVAAVTTRDAAHRYEQRSHVRTLHPIPCHATVCASAGSQIVISWDLARDDATSVMAFCGISKRSVRECYRTP